MWGARIGMIVGASLIGCGPSAPTSATVEVHIDEMSADNAVLWLHVRSGGSDVSADGRIELFIDGPNPPTPSAECRIGADVTAAQFHGSDGARIVVPFPPGCGATVPGRGPPFQTVAVFTTADRVPISAVVGFDALVGARMTYVEPAPRVVAPPPPTSAIATGSCNTPIAGACTEWTQPAGELALHQAGCSGDNSTWSLAPCPQDGALGRCALPTETIYSYATLDGAADQCTRYGGQFATLP